MDRPDGRNDRELYTDKTIYYIAWNDEMGQSSCSATDVQVSVVALNDLTLTRGTECKQQEPQAMYSVCVPDVTVLKNLLSATGSEINDSHCQHPHYHTDRNKVNGYEAPVLRNEVCYVRM